MSTYGFPDVLPNPPQPTGGSSDKSFFENDLTITTNYTITTGKNAGTFGPVTIASTATVTILSTSTWTVI
jgi:hypothetical protein